MDKLSNKEKTAVILFILLAAIKLLYLFLSYRQVQIGNIRFGSADFPSRNYYKIFFFPLTELLAAGLFIAQKPVGWILSAALLLTNMILSVQVVFNTASALKGFPLSMGLLFFYINDSILFIIGFVALFLLFDYNTRKKFRVANFSYLLMIVFAFLVLKLTLEMR